MQGMESVRSRPQTPPASAGVDVPVITIEARPERRKLPNLAMELLAFAAIGVAVMLLIPGSALTRIAGAWHWSHSPAGAATRTVTSSTRSPAPCLRSRSRR